MNKPFISRVLPNGLPWVGVLLLFSFAFMALFSSFTPVAQATINRQINFQGKIVLLSNSTNITSDTYNMEFRIYSGGDGVVGGGDETLLWTESRLRSAGNGVTITDGIFQVNLGAVTSLPGSVDFNNSTLWLSMNLGSNSAVCTPFSSCSGDGEMSPMVRFTSAAYAFNTDLLDGIDSTGFVQLAQGVQADSSTSNASLAINKTGATANIVDIQRAGSSVFLINNTGETTFKPQTDDVDAFRIQNAGATTTLLNVDTTGNGVITANVDVNLVYTGSENLAVTNTSGTASVDVVALTLTNSDGGANTQRGIVVTNADDAANATTEALISLVNAETTASTVSDGLLISGSAGGGTKTIVDAIDVSDDNITNGLNLGTNLLVASGDSINDFTGLGLAVATNALRVQLLDAADGAGGVGSRSGLEFGDTGNNELTLLQGCTDGQVLIWDDVTDVQWECASLGLDRITAASANGAVLDNNANTLSWNWDFTTAAVDSGLLISESSASTTGTQDQQALVEITTLATSTASPLQVTAAGTDVADVWFNLSGAADFEVRDGGTAVFTVADTGALTFAPTSGEDVILNFGGNGRLDINTVTYENNLGGIDVVRTGAFTGVAAETANEMRIAPGLTLTEPASGTFTWNGANIDMSGIAVTAGAGTTAINGLRIAGTSDADAGTVRGIFVDNLTATAATERGIDIGTGWDVGINVQSGGINVAAGQIVASNLGVEFTESDTNPTCAAGNYNIYADTSEAKIKKCVNGVVSDVQGENDVVYMTDAVDTAWADNNTTELWNSATQPNITPAHTGMELLIMVTLRATTDPGANETQPAARVDREIGSTADCLDTNTVGPTFGSSDSDNAAGDAASIQTMTNVFVDAPATTTNVSYTICTSLDSVLSGTNTENRTEFTIFPVNDSADLAEVYPTNDDSLKPGEVVSLDPGLENGVMRSSKAYDSSAIGIVSTQPALVIGGRSGEGVSGKPIAMSGRVPVKVAGPIRKGDILTSSAVPGVAMKAVKAGPMLGVAMTDYEGTDTGTVMVFVKTGYFNGSNLKELITEAPVLNAEGEMNVSASLLDYFIRNQSVTPLADYDASEILTDRVAAGLEIITPRLIANEVTTNRLLPGSSNELALEVGDDGKVVILGGAGQEVMRISSMGTTIANSLLLKGQLLADASAQFNRAVNFEDVVTFKGDVSFDGNVSFNNNFGGYARIKKNETEVTIPFSGVKEGTLPVVTVTQRSGAIQPYAYRDVTKDGFKIVLDKPALEDSEFSWSALFINNPQIIENSPQQSVMPAGDVPLVPAQ